MRQQIPQLHLRDATKAVDMPNAPAVATQQLAIAPLPLHNSETLGRVTRLPNASLLTYISPVGGYVSRTMQKFKE